MSVATYLLNSQVLLAFPVRTIFNLILSLKISFYIIDLVKNYGKR